MHATCKHYVEVKQIAFLQKYEKRNEVSDLHALLGQLIITLACTLVGILDISNSDQDGSHTYKRGSRYSLCQHLIQHQLFPSGEMHITCLLNGEKKPKVRVQS